MLTEHQWIKKVILPALSKQGAIVFNKQRGNVYDGAGVADLHVTHRLWTGWLEIKGVATKVQPMQKLFLGERFLRDPGSTFIARLLKGDAFGAILAPNGRELLLFNAETCEDLLPALQRCRIAAIGEKETRGKAYIARNYC